MGYKINFLGAYDVESLIEELKRISSITGRPTVTTADIDGVGRVSSSTVIERFGSMGKANEAAGLIPQAIRYWSDEELLDALIEVWNQAVRDGKTHPSQQDARRYKLPVNASTISARFGTWNKALLAANERAERRWVTRPPKKRGARGTISRRTRFVVFKRDQYTCQICRKDKTEIEVDHVVPLARGGSDELDNLQTLCVECNRGKGDSLQ